MSPANPISQLFEEVYGASRLNTDFDTGDFKWCLIASLLIGMEWLLTKSFKKQDKVKNT